jgi:hypothetical protein
MHYTGKFPSKKVMDKHIDTDCWEGSMKYTIEIESDDKTYLPNFMKIGSGIVNLIRRNRGHTNSMQNA